MKGVIFMSGRRIYSDELKLEMVQRYFSGEGGTKFLAQKYHVDRTSLQKWIAQYRANGVDGIVHSSSTTYSGDFKVAVVEYMHNTGSSQQQTAAHFGIPSKESVAKWERIYYEEGKEALFEERRGRSSKMGIKKPRKPKKDVNVNEDLLAEVQRLRMENEYLKKLNALVQEREKFEKSTK